MKITKFATGAIRGTQTDYLIMHEENK